MDNAGYCVNSTPQTEKMQAKLEHFRQLYKKLYTSCDVYSFKSMTAWIQPAGVGAGTAKASVSGVAAGVGVGTANASVSGVAAGSGVVSGS